MTEWVAETLTPTTGGTSTLRSIPLSATSGVLSPSQSLVGKSGTGRRVSGEGAWRPCFGNSFDPNKTAGISDRTGRVEFVLGSLSLLLALLTGRELGSLAGEACRRRGESFRKPVFAGRGRSEIPREPGFRLAERSALASSWSLGRGALARRSVLAGVFLEVRTGAVGGVGASSVGGGFFEAVFFSGVRGCVFERGLAVTVGTEGTGLPTRCGVDSANGTVFVLARVFREFLGGAGVAVVSSFWVSTLIESSGTLVAEGFLGESGIETGAFKVTAGAGWTAGGVVADLALVVDFFAEWRAGRSEVFGATVVSAACGDGRFAEGFCERGGSAVTFFAVGGVAGG